MAGWATESVRVPAEIETAARLHATWCAPNEACGLLAIDETGDIRFFYPIENLEQDQKAFTLNPAQLLRAANHAERMGWELGGVMHSHPTGRAHPSRIDVAKWTGGSWLVMVVARSGTGYFRIIDGQVRPVHIRAAG